MADSQRENPQSKSNQPTSIESPVGHGIHSNAQNVDADENASGLVRAVAAPVAIQNDISDDMADQAIANQPRTNPPVTDLNQKGTGESSNVPNQELANGDAPNSDLNVVINMMENLDLNMRLEEDSPSSQQDEESEQTDSPHHEEVPPIRANSTANERGRRSFPSPNPSHIAHARELLRRSVENAAILLQVVGGDVAAFRNTRAARVEQDMDLVLSIVERLNIMPTFHDEVTPEEQFLESDEDSEAHEVEEAINDPDVQENTQCSICLSETMVQPQRCRMCRMIVGCKQ
ncbi:unnamed protein product [Caenorhabditis bovis]|uniref:Uncharacterized protein n=1 Tax=Caenorhabditis bovis TaxID=2654633 RepID=A0A8S1FDG0_9PELO|nr:unnamed protein product [Caenorhabditis bovis]